MRHYDVVIEGTGVADILVGDEDALFFLGRDALLVDGRSVRHHGFTIGVDGDEGFLSLTIKNVEKDVFNEFMRDKTPEDVLEGTGVPTFLAERSSEDAAAGLGPDTLSWEYGTDIVIPVHSLRFEALEPAVA